jgi:hypothetical protein
MIYDRHTVTYGDIPAEPVQPISARDYDVYASWCPSHPLASLLAPVHNICDLFDLMAYLFDLMAVILTQYDGPLTGPGQWAFDVRAMGI